jgi:hypothetical protein
MLLILGIITIKNLKINQRYYWLIVDQASNKNGWE